MIKRYRFKNFYSFREEAVVSFEVGKQPSQSGYDLTFADQSRGNKVVAVLGPNGAGKTQLLKPMAFLSWFISRSFLNAEPQQPIPVRPHKLDEDSPIEFEVDFELAGKAYRYQLHVTPQHVLHEALFVKTSRLYSYLFVRERRGDRYAVKQKGFGMNASHARGIRGNASLLAAGHVHDVATASKIVAYFERYSSNLRVIGRAHYDHQQLLNSAHFFSENQALHERARRAICELDLGLSDVELREMSVRDETGEETDSFHVPFGEHRLDGGQGFSLPFFEESSGTQAAYVLLRYILPVLESGGVAVIDEFDSDLHPHMLEVILDLFRLEHTNPHEAQLLFSCHTSEALNLLAKHQVYLVEKRDLASETWRLDEVVGLRSDDNLFAKYHAGALGAVPDI